LKKWKTEIEKTEELKSKNWETEIEKIEMNS